MQLLILIYLFFLNKAWAQDLNVTMLGVSPTIIEQVLTPGEVNVKKIRVFNLTELAGTGGVVDPRCAG